MMIIFKRLVVLLRAHVDRASWRLLCLVTALHMGLVWGLLMLANEQALLPANVFFYYYIITTSTVGYGDFSATTDFGRWVVALVQVPFGLGLFGVLLGKAGQMATFWIKRAMTGDKDYFDFRNHIIIFGWHPTRTKKIIDYILADTKRDNRRIVLAVTDAIEHPLMGYPEVNFARLTSFTEDEQLARIAIVDADKVIIDGQDDDQTFTTALKLSPMIKADAHISAHFQDESKVSLLRSHCKNVECSSVKSAEILVRAMQDPGSSRVQEELLSSLHGDTQFSLQLPQGVKSYQFGELFPYFKAHHNAILLGVAHDKSAQNLDLNPPLDYKICAGDVLHYIAPSRVLAKEVLWQAI
ncbi:potassium channel family protein [Pseudoalteromonas aurantia]|uniref:Potassium channel protein n=1 Tax=Pseudoalteromonas aurantia TaxID=43654 RepID=A0A5S3V884_9GAMM|nr:potassium channel family protein [Pseudoalteromonas aurantia]TMO67000.1 potassium channel protein [Pseudoalteromonas aurantia]TMO67367.1 potassium channel protein [Pseudoalteromonas aurantia]TMO74733.1 potassium channel protein [Pseudoalteromonas aurantia]